MKSSLAILLASLICLLPACGDNPDASPTGPTTSKPTPPSLAINGATMGTTFQIKLSELPKGQSLAQIESQVHALLNRLDLLMSTYRDDSEVSQFNRLLSNEWFPVSRETLLVIQHAQHVSVTSKGRFDITVGPLIDLWKFGTSRPLETIPTDSQIELATKQVDFRKLELTDNPPRIRKTSPEIKIDLSAIAKGYAVDCIADYLSSQRITGYMVEIGGEIRTAGHSPTGKHWTIGIESPQSDQRTIHRTVALNINAMATSGNYRNYHDIDGKRYGHTLDPTLGRPVSHNTVSVTVIAPTCMHADAMATALLVMGADEGMSLAESLGLAVLFIQRNAAGTLEERPSSAFRPFIAK